MLVSIDELRSSLLSYLATLGLDDRDRRTLADLVVEQEMVGNRFSAVRNIVKKGDHISPSDIREEVVVRKPAMTLVRGHGRMAPLITADYLDSAIATARSQGIYALGIYDSTYNDFFEVFCRRVAHEGCIGLIFENG